MGESDLSFMTELNKIKRLKEQTIFTFCNMISARPPIYGITVDGSHYYGEHLCDALWQAVKGVL